MADLFELLDARGIAYQRTDHPAVFTVEEARRLVPPLPATPTKNLFLRDQKGARHFLVVVGHDKAVDLKGLAPAIGSSKLSLGSPERLKARLGIEPGAVSLLALVNDPGHTVEVFIDRALWQADALQCHPLVNTATLVIARDGIEAFLKATGHPWRLVDVPAREAREGS
jgi:Ala-tRNA(Pro) deacylase